MEMRKLVALLVLLLLGCEPCLGKETAISCDGAKKDKIQEFMAKCVVSESGEKSINRCRWKAAAVFDCKDVSEISETIQCRQEHLTFKYSEPESPI